MARLTNKEALELLENMSLLDLGRMASQKKLEIHPKRITTFVVDRNINYTNICWIGCKFCAFYVKEKDKNAYILTYDEIDRKIDEILEIVHYSICNGLNLTIR